MDERTRPHKSPTPPQSALDQTHSQQHRIEGNGSREQEEREEGEGGGVPGEEGGGDEGEEEEEAAAAAAAARGGSNTAAIEEEEEKGCVFEASAVEDTCRPRGVFEFPWDDHCGEALDGSDLQDVFFSSLVDGRSAAIGVPGDRLSPPTTSPIALPDEASQPSDADGDADGVDCIWSTVLREPLAVVCTRGFRA
uniref:Uncharacterized protein n=1 Tax=Ananas comosus var. bracteatus TaxID=296719 RepID=A0A6V7QR32_ANACO